MSNVEEKAALRRFFFRRENRVLKRAEFKRVYNEAKPMRRSLVHAFILAPAAQPSETPMPPTRIGITATKKAGNSVHRNRARRLVRESFRLMLPDLKPGYTIIVNTMRAATTAPQAKVEGQLREIFQQAGLFQQI